jgi:hypothetical protein
MSSDSMASISEAGYFSTLMSARVRFLSVTKFVLRYRLILILGAPLSLSMLFSEGISLSYSGSSELVEFFDSS